MFCHNVNILQTHLLLEGACQASEECLYFNLLQWSFGVTCWEIFSGGRTPYPGIDPLTLVHMLDTHQMLGKPLNAACSNEL